MSNKPNKKTVDPASQKMIDRAQKEGVATSWDRLEATEPQCGFGKLGICCTVCHMGPCRVDPFGEGAQVGVCGADADTIAARNLLRHIAAGAAAHSDHGRDVAHTLLMVGEGKTKDYHISDERKLAQVAQYYGIAVVGKSKEQIATEVAKEGLAEFGRQEGEL